MTVVPPLPVSLPASLRPESASAERDGDEFGVGRLADPGPQVFLSPHADDVGFSCVGLLRALAQAAGHSCSLVTVFLSGDQAEQRRSEDGAAAKLLGCSVSCLELPDAPDRPEVRAGLDRFMPYGPPHLGIANEIVHRLLPRLSTPATLYAPLAVGGHIDHRIVHEAARALAYQLGPALRLVFYEDLPYALARYSLARRLAALGDTRGLVGQRAPLSAEIAAYRRWLLSHPLLGRRLPGLRTLVAHRLAQVAVQADCQPPRDRPGFVPRLRPQLVRADGIAELEAKVIAAYASQWPLFASSPAELSARFAGYGQQVGEQHQRPAGRYQRLWIDSGAYGP